MPLRKCAGCSVLHESSQMIRIMKVHDSGKILINPESRYFGRSVYLCYNKNCVQNAFKRKRISKTLKTEIPIQIIEKIKALTDN